MTKEITGSGNNGVTLVELLAVIAIAGILILFLGFEFRGWQGRYRIENQTKQFYADLMEARTRAITRNFPYLVAMDARRYLIAEDTNNSGTINAGDTPLWGSLTPKSLEYGYSFRIFGAGSFPTPANPLVIDTRGLVSIGAATGYVGIDSTGFNPDYDCIIVTQGRIRMGKWDGGASCSEK